MTVELYMLIWIIVSFLFVAFFAGIETAFISVNKLSVELKKKQGKPSGAILSRLMEEPVRFLGACLVAANVFLVLYGLLFSELLKLTLWNPLRLQNDYLQLAFNTLFSGFIIVILGSFIPKAVFRAKNLTLLSFFSSIIDFFYNLFYPVAAVFVTMAKGILLYLFNVKIKDKDEPFAKIDLDHFLQQNRDLNEDNQELNSELFENALSLPTVKIRRCLVPRTEIEAVDIRSSMEMVKQKFIQTQLSKIIVYDENIDNILGYIHQLDLFKKSTDISSILLPIPAVPESMSATFLISKFSKERKSIAWVVDEFGGTAGIVTMEDVLEEIFGEIHDEHDKMVLVENQISETEFIFSGRMELDYLNEKYKFEFPENESETLSGYIINAHETIPKLKERIIIDSYEFDVLEVSDTRIEMVKMKLLR